MNVQRKSSRGACGCDKPDPLGSDKAQGQSAYAHFHDSSHAQKINDVNQQTARARLEGHSRGQQGGALAEKFFEVLDSKPAHGHSSRQNAQEGGP